MQVLARKQHFTAFATLSQFCNRQWEQIFILFQKMLDHKYLNTMQVYARIIDETKRMASNRIKLEM
jgi:hypothetical protein